MHKIKLVMSDIDNTLLAHGEAISADNLAMIEKLLDDGVIVVPTTGRYHRAIPEVFLTNDRIKYIVSSNGAQITNLETNEIIKQVDIDKDLCVEILEMIESHAKHIFVVTATGVVIDKRVLKNRRHEEGSFFARLQKEAEIPEDIVEYVKNNDLVIKKIEFSFDDLDFRNKVYDKLKQNKLINAVSSHVSNVEVTSVNASKGLALTFLQEELNISEDEIMAIGDNDNDVSMLQAAGIGVVMGQASDYVKSHGDMVTLEIGEDGFAHAVKKIFKY